mmetsp:Transcript_43205/g.97650  ORF Transcript_43205/g.97650 Transcript_43205/m.97650 type:complete len:270 (+) Transcript_43205:424-1233(+)
MIRASKWGCGKGAVSPPLAALSPREADAPEMGGCAGPQVRGAAAAPAGSPKARGVSKLPPPAVVSLETRPPSRSPASLRVASLRVASCVMVRHWWRGSRYAHVRLGWLCPCGCPCGCVAALLSARFSSSSSRMAPCPAGSSVMVSCAIVSRDSLFLFELKDSQDRPGVSTELRFRGNAKPKKVPPASVWCTWSWNSTGSAVRVCAACWLSARSGFGSTKSSWRQKTTELMESTGLHSLPRMGSMTLPDSRSMLGCQARVRHVTAGAWKG